MPDLESLPERRELLNVANMRFGDAQALIDAQAKDRANGAVYLAGFVLEILLKSELAHRYPNARSRRVMASTLSEAERRAWRMIWSSHDLYEMLVSMPDLETAFAFRQRRDKIRYRRNFQQINGIWSIELRYTPIKMPMSQARTIVKWVDQIRKLMQ